MNKITMDGIKRGVIDTGVSIEQVVLFIKMNGTAYRKEILDAVDCIQSDDMIDLDNEILEGDKDLWIEMADM